MLEINPCPRCGEKVEIYAEILPFRSGGIAVVNCRSCDLTEAAPAKIYSHSPADPAIERWNNAGKNAGESAVNSAKNG